MRFNELTREDTSLIVNTYFNNLSKEADKMLSEKFDVSERTVRNWAKNLSLTGNKIKDIEVDSPEIVLGTPTSDETVLVKDPTYYWNLLSEEEKTYQETQYALPIMYEEGGHRVLVVGDIHAPFDLTKYLDHLKWVYDMYQCNTVVFIGDVIDNHYSSFHNTDPNGLGGGDELDYAIARIQRYHYLFPKAYVIIGNHDRMTARKAFANGVPKQWIKDYSEVLQVPGWEFVTELELDDVLYFHGEGGTAKTRVKSEAQSVVQGHLHTQAYIEWLFSNRDRKFAMQVGTGIDFSQYAFAYAKAGKKPAVSCGVILNGKYPSLIPMDL